MGTYLTGGALALLCLGLAGLSAAASGPLKVSDNGRFLVRQDDAPFFWLGDTAWLLMVKLDQEEAEHYLKTRASQGFTVIQTMVAPWHARTTANVAGELAFLDGDPARPNEKYFAHVDEVVRAAAKLGLHVGLLPTWGDAYNPWEGGSELLTPENAEVYGEFLGRRYRDQPVIWILGGDRDPENERQHATIRALAKGLRKGDGGRHLLTFHPTGWSRSARYFHNEAWLSFNMLQSGHSVHNPRNYELIATDYALTPAKPCLDGEANYEDHPVNWKPENGYFDDYDVRKTAYWAVFAGACGHTYGCHDIWQFHREEEKSVDSPRTPWQEALKLPGAQQMKHLRALMESRPYLSRIPDQSLIVAEGTGDAPEARHVQATREADGFYAMLYIPTAGQTVKVDTRKLSGEQLKAWWYDPRTGKATALKGDFDRGGMLEFTTPAEGPDWVLVLDDGARDYPAPGVVRRR